MLQVQMYGIGSREGSHHLIDLCKIDCPGVFDLRWRPCQSHQAGVNTEPVDRQADPSNSGSRQDLIREGGDMAALALADGSCQLVEIRDVGITAVATQPNAACGGMSLSCDWSTFATTDLFCSSSNGMISQCRVAESALVQTQEWQAHEMEAWMVTCDLHQVLHPDYGWPTVCQMLHILCLVSSSELFMPDECACLMNVPGNQCSCEESMPLSRTAG